MEIPLSENSLIELTKLHKKTKNKKQADRIKIILLFNKGYTQKEIASNILIKENTVSYWIKKFKSSLTVDDWIKNNYRPYWGKLTSIQLAQVQDYIRKNIIIDLRQVITYVKEQFGVNYSISGMNHLIHSLGFSFKQLSLFPTKADIKKQQKFVTEYQEINNNLEEDDEIVFLDGVHPQHNTKAVKAWIEKGVIKYIRTNTGQNRLNLNGAYNPNNQDVIIREDNTINAQSTIKLFNQIEIQYPNANLIYAFSDNAMYYKCKLIKEYLKNSRIKLIFLPPYSPNLNLIERLWKFMRMKVINTTYYPDFESFKTAIRNFFKNIDKYKNDLKKFIGNKFQLIEINPKTTLA